MRGKTVVITGGTSGIGEVAAVALAKMGARIVLESLESAKPTATHWGASGGPGITGGA